MDAINFDIIAGQQTAEGYHCTLRYEPLGDAEGTFQVDLGEGPLSTLLAWAASSVTEGSANLDSTQELGHQLHQTLFRGELGEFLRSALQDAEDEGVPLRLRLSTKDLTLMSLPWEFLYDRRRDRLFAVDQDTPLVRYLSDYATFGRPRPLAATLPLRLLMVVPAVEDLDVQDEIQRVQAALQRGKLLGQHVELVSLSDADGPVTIEALRDFLQEDAQGFDILHFSGHGDTRGGRGNIRFNSAAGGEKWVAGGTFARTLKPYASPKRQRPLRLVVLNTCEGGVSAPKAYGARSLLGMAPALIQNGVPAVVAMQYQILDTAALAFARAFYRALVLGDTAGRVDAAVTDARQALESQFEGHRSFATPALFLRAPGGVLFQLAAPPQEPTRPAASGMAEPAPPAMPEAEPVLASPLHEQPKPAAGPYADLKQQLADGEVCAFVGAGLSVGAGLPGWYQLISGLAEHIGYELPEPRWAGGDILIEAAQAYVNERGLHSLVSYLKDQLDTVGKAPTAAHRALARLPISLVFTANYDDLLERAFRDAGRRVEIVVRDSSIPFMRRDPGSVNIVKLYGDLDQPDTIVLARQQYERYFLERPQLVKLLETELARSTMLYLGWSHSDPHFNLVFGELLGRYQDMLRTGYAAMFDVPDAQRRELARRHIQVVELPAEGDRTAQLGAWLESLPA